MLRSELWIGAGGVSYATKPRPVLILQAESFSARESVTVCLVTSDPEAFPDFRVAVPADDRTGLLKPSYVMIDKVMTLSRDNMSRCIGRLSEAQMSKVDRLLLIFLGLAR